MGDGLSNYFETYLEKELLFKNKKVMQEEYSPSAILHREKELSQIAKILAPSLRDEKPSNLFIFGSPGTGKTLAVKHTCAELEGVAQSKGIPVKVVHVNCKQRQVADTQYRLFAELAKALGKAVPSTGLPTDDIYRIFLSAVDREKMMLILILDEIDELIGKEGGEILYKLTNFNTELRNSTMTILGISNSARFMDELDLRVRSRLNMESMLFSKYDAQQLQDILRQRATEAFRTDIVAQGVIEKCAAFAAKDHGDARLAINLLRVAGELAERQNSPHVSMNHLDEAEQKINTDNVLDLVGSYPRQYQIVLFAALIISEQKKEAALTGELCEIYEQLCKKVHERPLTQRRVGDIISEMDMSGLLSAKVSSKGRYGRTREITLAIQGSLLPRVRKKLEEALGIT